MHQIICSPQLLALRPFQIGVDRVIIWSVASHKGKAASGRAAPCRLSTSLAGLADCNTSACRAQIVTQTMPVRRATLCEPQVPRDCPADVLKLIFDCTALIADDRPSTKVQNSYASGTDILLPRTALPPNKATYCMVHGCPDRKKLKRCIGRGPCRQAANPHYRIISPSVAAQEAFDRLKASCAAHIAAAAALRALPAGLGGSALGMSRRKVIEAVAREFGGVPSGSSPSSIFPPALPQQPPGESQLLAACERR